MIRWIVLFLVVLSPAWAASWYCDNSSAGTDVGTEANPFKTLAHAQLHAASGDTVYMYTGSGTYSWTFEQNHAARTDYVKYIAQTGNTPVINGAVKVSQYPETLRDIYLWFEDLTITGYVYIGQSKYIKIVNCTITGPGYDPHHIADGTYNGIEYKGINLVYCDTVLIDGVTINGSGAGHGTDDGTHNLGDGPAQCTGTSTSGQSGALYCKAFLEGINVAYNMDAAKRCTNVTIQNCNVSSCDMGIQVSGNDYTVKDCTVSYGTNNLITVSGANEDAGTACLIEGNDLFRTARFNTFHTDMIQFQDVYSTHTYTYHNITVRGNKIHDGDQQGIFWQMMTSASDGILVENNLMYNMNLENAGPMQCTRIQGAGGITFRNNTIVKGPLGGDGSAGVLFESMDQPTGHAVVTSCHNNIIEGFLDFYHDPYSAGSHTSCGTETTYEDYNYYVHNGWHSSLPTPMTRGAHDVKTTEAAIKALFSNYEGNDYHLAASLNGDPAADYYATDILGVTRGDPLDIGAYEYNSDSPVLASIGSKSVVEGSAISMDADATGGTAPLVYSISNEPSGMTINSSTGVVSWTPTASPSQAGIYYVTVLVTDAADLTDSEVVQVTCTAKSVDHDPVLASIGNLDVQKGVAWGIYCNAVDADGDSKTWSYSGLPGWVTTASTSTGELGGTPSSSGSWNITVTVTANGKTDTETFRLRVTTYSSGIPVYRTIFK